MKQADVSEVRTTPIIALMMDAISNSLLHFNGIYQKTIMFIIDNVRT
jgi:energy-converting hydrogenase Eha subunit A